MRGRRRARIDLEPCERGAWEALRIRSARGSGPAGGVGFEDFFDFVADAAEDDELFFFVAGRVSRVVEAPVMFGHLPRIQGASLVGVTAYGDDGVHIAAEEIVHVFRGVRADVDADFRHGFDGEGVDVAGWFGTGAVHVEEVAAGSTEEAFGHVAAAGVAGAENEDERGGHFFVFWIAGGGFWRAVSFSFCNHGLLLKAWKGRSHIL
jgi:hypothetical protein